MMLGAVRAEKRGEEICIVGDLGRPSTMEYFSEIGIQNEQRKAIEDLLVNHTLLLGSGCRARRAIICCETGAEKSTVTPFAAKGPQEDDPQKCFFQETLAPRLMDTFALASWAMPHFESPEGIWQHITQISFYRRRGHVCLVLYTEIRRSHQSWSKN
jgi:hypothetical protein